MYLKRALDIPVNNMMAHLPTSEPCLVNVEELLSFQEKAQRQDEHWSLWRWFWDLLPF